MLSHIPEWNPIFRIDAEFFNKKSINIDAYIRNMKYIHLHQDEVVSGPFGSTLKSESYLTSGYMPFVRIENIRGGFNVNTNNIVYISESNNARIKNSELQLNDIVLSKVGNSIGYFARVDEQLGRCNISENNIGIKLERYSTHFKHYLVAYLNSKYAQNLVKRRTSGNAQPKLNVGDMCYIPIPTFSEAIYKAISKIILRSEDNIVAAVSAYQAAEKLLSTIINVPTDTTRCNTYSKLLSNTLSISGRLDAEYYHPKYEAYAKALHTVDTVNSLCTIHDKNYVPKNKKLYKYIELANVGKSGDITDVELIEGSELPSRARRQVNTGQVLVSSVEGSLQGCVLITDEFDGALCSTGFYVLTSDTINPETLLVIFKSETMQVLLKQRCSGTILTAITKDELLSMPLPKIDDSIQVEIAEKVQMSFSLRRQSVQLLECATRAVEMAIEKGENAALAWLNSKVSNAEV